MKIGRVGSVWLWAGWLVAVGAIGQNSAWGEEQDQAENEEGAVITLSVESVTAESGKETCEEGCQGCEKCNESCDAEETANAATASSGGGLFGIFFGSGGDDANAADSSAQDFPPTHRQVALLKVEAVNSSAGKKDWGVKSFCLDGEDNLLVAVGDTADQLQLLSPKGERLQSISLPIVPEAVNVDPEGNYLVAGEGKILKLDPSGEVLLRGKSPIITRLEENKDELREQVVQQMNRSAGMMVQQRDRYQKMIDDTIAKTVKQLDDGEREEYLLLRKRVDGFSDADATELSAEDENAWALRKDLLRMLQAKVEQKITKRDQKMIDLCRKRVAAYDEYIKRNPSSDPTDEQVEQALAATLARKSGIASISEANGDVFIATSAVQGYGYDVWRLDENLENPEKIVSELRGCCGQMDVQASEAGVFVAENSRHQVCHFDREGKKINNWGGRDRSGVQGFSSCCNPMNVAFGPDGSVYTAESNNGRIKRFSKNGKLEALVGSVELVPGCKKVSIAVTKDNRRVYMLDITRNHIIVMEAKPRKEQVASK